METVRYEFCPSAFAAKRIVTLDDAGVTVRDGDGPERHFAWSDIGELHIEPSTLGTDKRRRWVLHLKPRNGKAVSIDSVDVRGPTEVEHKSAEWKAAVEASLQALANQKVPVRYRLGARRGVVWAWRFSLALLTLVGVGGTVAGVMTAQWDVVIYAAVFVVAGVVGLMALRRSGGLVDFNPSTMAAWNPPGSG